MAKLDSTNLAIAQDDKGRIAQRTVGTPRLAVPCDGVAPSQGQHLFENGLGEPGQVIANLHQRQGAGDLGSRNPQSVRQLEVAQRFHLLLEVVLGNARQPLAQFGSEFRRQRRAEQPPRVEQLVEQQRKARDLLGDPRTASTKLEQTLQGAGVFSQ